MQVFFGSTGQINQYAKKRGKLIKALIQCMQKIKSTVFTNVPYIRLPTVTFQKYCSHEKLWEKSIEKKPDSVRITRKVDPI